MAANTKDLTLEFEPLHTENYEQAFKLQLACHAYPWSRKVFVDCLTPPYFACKASLDKSVVGFFVGLQVLDEATLMDIGVASQCRGKGVGLALLRYFIQQCRKQNAASIWLEVRISNDAAIGLYTKEGFQQTEIRKHYYPTASGKEDACIMLKRL